MPKSVKYTVERCRTVWEAATVVMPETDDMDAVIEEAYNLGVWEYTDGETRDIYISDSEDA